MNQSTKRLLSAGACVALLLTGTVSGAGAQEELSSLNPVLIGFQTPINAKIAEPAEPSASMSWSLPFSGPLDSGILNKTLRSTAPVLLNPQKPERLDASINTDDGGNLVSRTVERLLEKALDNDDQAKQLDKAVLHYRKASQRALAQTKDAADYIVPYRGFGPSIEAANLVTGEKISVKSRAAAEYARQKHVDETHIKVVSSVMQMAMGLGMSDPEKGAATVDSGFQSLKSLVGEEEATRTKDTLAAWSKEIVVPESVYAQGAWDVQLRQNKRKLVLEAALDNDEVLHQITKHLHKYGHKSKFTRMSSQVIQTTLATAALTPSFIGPAAKTALLAYVMATGGPESCKLLKELYLDKRFESRWKVLNEESHLALENYQIAILTRNPVLLACSESFVSEMSGEQTVTDVFGTKTAYGW
ncbi:MAG: hypothetical protein U0105_25735 [Candidatus Obscuribacterales bacterium]